MVWRTLATYSLYYKCKERVGVRWSTLSPYIGTTKQIKLKEVTDDGPSH